jgi:hypothetical protein
MTLDEAMVLMQAKAKEAGMSLEDWIIMRCDQELKDLEKEKEQ